MNARECDDRQKIHRSVPNPVHGSPQLALNGTSNCGNPKETVGSIKSERRCAEEMQQESGYETMQAVDNRARSDSIERPVVMPSPSMADAQSKTYSVRPDALAMYQEVGLTAVPR